MTNLETCTSSVPVSSVSTEENQGVPDPIRGHPLRSPERMDNHESQFSFRIGRSHAKTIRPPCAPANAAKANGQARVGKTQAELKAIRALQTKQRSVRGARPYGGPLETRRITRLYESRFPFFHRSARDARRRGVGIVRQARHMPASISPAARGPPHTSQYCSPR